jgi:uncharacterized repeat protein (TIGR01451 family)
MPIYITDIYDDLIYISDDFGTIGTTGPINIKFDNYAHKLKPGESICENITFNIPSTYIQNSITNIVTSSDNYGNTASSIITTPINKPLLTIKKNILTPGPYYAGQIVSYEITIGHDALLSKADAYNLQIQDIPSNPNTVITGIPIITILPKLLAYTQSTSFNDLLYMPKLPLGATVIIQYNAIIGIDSTGNQLNTALCVYYPANTTDSTVAKTIQSKANIYIGPPNIYINKSSYPIAHLNDIVVWTINYGNNGYSTVFGSGPTGSGPTITEGPLPSWVTYDNTYATTPINWISIGNGYYNYTLPTPLLPNTNETIKFPIKIIGPIPYNITTLSNTVKLTGRNISASDTEIIQIKAKPLLKIIKVLSPTSEIPAPGNDITYTLTVKNNGTQQAKLPITITETIPSGLILDLTKNPGWTTPHDNQTTYTYTGTVDYLNPGSSFSINIIFTIPCTYTVGTIINTALILDTNGNIVTESTFEVCIQYPLICIKQYPGIYTIKPCKIIPWIIEYKNEGNQPAIDTILFIPDLPPFIEVLDSENIGWIKVHGGYEYNINIIPVQKCENNGRVIFYIRLCESVPACKKHIRINVILNAKSPTSCVPIKICNKNNKNNSALIVKNNCKK